LYIDLVRLHSDLKQKYNEKNDETKIEKNQKRTKLVIDLTKANHVIENLTTEINELKTKCEGKRTRPLSPLWELHFNPVPGRVDKVTEAKCIDCNVPIYIGKSPRIGRAMIFFAKHKCLFYEDCKARIRSLPPAQQAVSIVEE